MIAPQHGGGYDASDSKVTLLTRKSSNSEIRKKESAHILYLRRNMAEITPVLSRRLGRKEGKNKHIPIYN